MARLVTVETSHHSARPWAIPLVMRSSTLKTLDIERNKCLRSTSRIPLLSMSRRCSSLMLRIMIWLSLLKASPLMALWPMASCPSHPLLVIFFKDSAHIHQSGEVTNSMQSHCFFNLGSQPANKLHAPRSIISCIVVVRMITGQLPKSRSILTNRHIPLGECQELQLAFLTRILGKVGLQESLSKQWPSDSSSTGLKSSSGAIPPILSLFSQGVYSKHHLVSLSAL